MSVAQVYNEIAKEFANTRTYQWPWITDYVNKIKSGNKELTFLDIGCGSGRNIKAYSDNLVKIKGIDLSNEFVNMCKKQNMDVVLGNMIRMPFESDLFNHIMCIASFHHLETADERFMAINEIWRVLKKNGTALISIWSKIQPKKTKRVFENYGDIMVPWRSTNGKEYQRYYYIFKIEEIVSLIKKAGFTIDKMFWDCGNEVFIIRKN